MNLYSITDFHKHPYLVYIIKASSTKDALDFLTDHLKNVSHNLSLAFYERSYDMGLFDSPDPEIIDILPHDLYLLKY